MIIKAMNDNGDDHYDGSFTEPCPLASQFIKPHSSPSILCQETPLREFSSWIKTSSSLFPGEVGDS
jgi:hypothetical protein